MLQSPTTRHTEMQLLTHLWLPEDPVNSKNVVEHFIEQHQRHIQLFFIKHLSNEVLERYNRLQYNSIESNLHN